MTQEGFKKSCSNKKEKESKPETKPEICGWALLQMAKDKRQSEQNKSKK